MQAIVKVEFIMNFTPDEKGKVKHEVKFSLPGHPDTPITDKIKKLALEQVGDLCAVLTTHPDALPG